MPAQCMKKTYMIVKCQNIRDRKDLEVKSHYKEQELEGH